MHEPYFSQMHTSPASTTYVSQELVITKSYASWMYSSRHDYTLIWEETRHLRSHTPIVSSSSSNKHLCLLQTLRFRILRVVVSFHFESWYLHQNILISDQRAIDASGEFSSHNKFVLITQWKETGHPSKGDTIKHEHWPIEWTCKENFNEDKLILIVITVEKITCMTTFTCHIFSLIWFTQELGVRFLTV